MDQTYLSEDYEINLDKPLLDQLFDMVYYINLDKDVDRRISIESQLDELNVKNRFRIKASVFKTKPENVFIYRHFQAEPDKYVLGALGCRDSHLRAIHHAKISNYKKILILEDDAYFPNNFEKDLINNLNFFDGGYDMFYLGGSMSDKTNTIVLAHAYALSYQMFDEIIYQAPVSGLELDLFYSLVIQKMYTKYELGNYKYRIKYLDLIKQKKFLSNIKG